MNMLIAFLVTAGFVGIIVTYVQPTVSSLVPASLKSNPYLSIVTVGGVTLLSLMFAFFALRALRLPRMGG